ncbi:hypothetical protein OAT67_00100 [Bacteriovoracaceae bacterium]|nr:hypothetical protein [Bacteriovoracaceae bacterium]|tara:strand:- start:286533 stop:287066 length:534 start_codon:yes stop_codon:yes gene_type:complete
MNEFIDTDHISTTWIENLALEEINMEESGIINMNDHLNPIHFLEESSINFMNLVRDRFEVYIQKFNQYRSNSASHAQIKMFKISNTVNDFMLFRNSLRLIFSRKSNNLVTIGFLANGKDLYAPRVSEGDSFGTGPVHEINANIGAFNKITWKFQGEIVDVDAMVRHYLSEFIRQSAR